MRVHMKASLAMKATLAAGALFVGYNSMVSGYTAAPSVRDGRSVAQTATAGRSTGKGTDQAKPAPEPRPVGSPLGSPVAAVIGPNGGTLKSTDAAVRLDVPPGAVAKNTTFTVQTITNDVPGRIGHAFRITPEGTTFAVPATLTFGYKDEDVVGSSPALLRVAYQDQRGFWRAPSGVTVDEQAHTVSVRTTHLSDWTAFTSLRIEPATAVVKVGGTVPLTVWNCGPPAEDSNDPEYPDRLEPLCRPFYSEANGAHVDRWAVDGIAGGNAVLGMVAPTDVLERATYVAPARGPKADPLAVSVAYHAPGSRGVQILSADITVVDPNPSCAELRHTDVLDGGMTFSYDFAGTSEQGHRYDVSQSATIVARLTRVKDGNSPAPDANPSILTWRGSANAHPSLFASFGMDGVTQSVVGTDGFPGGSEMTVTVRVKDCTYQVTANATATSITTMDVKGMRVSTEGNTFVGSAATGVHPVAGSMSGSGNFSLGPQDREISGRYNPGGFGNTLLADFKPGELGKATVTWVVGLTPRRQP